MFALSSAAVSKAIARACSQGFVSSCTCGPFPKRKQKHFIWAGCSDNIKYANTFGRKFMDAADQSGISNARYSL